MLLEFGAYYQFSQIPKSLSEVLYENEDFKQRKLAALLASKVFFHLGEFTDAMSYALGAGELFDVNGKSEYNETLVGMNSDPFNILLHFF